jgi:hypothetical protein
MTMAMRHIPGGGADAPARAGNDPRVGKGLVCARGDLQLLRQVPGEEQSNRSFLREPSSGEISPAWLEALSYPTSASVGAQSRECQ